MGMPLEADIYIYILLLDIGIVISILCRADTAVNQIPQTMKLQYRPALIINIINIAIHCMLKTASTIYILYLEVNYEMIFHEKRILMHIITKHP